MIYINEGDKPIFLTTMLSFLLVFDILVMKFYNEILVDIPCWFLCINLSFLFIIDTNKHF